MKEGLESRGLGVLCLKSRSLGVEGLGVRGFGFRGVGFRLLSAPSGASGQFSPNYFLTCTLDCHWMGAVTTPKLYVHVQPYKAIRTVCSLSIKHLELEAYKNPRA